eukprot:scaffold228205_cov29-Tisochrysis_lutea.AAC.3
MLELSAVGTCGPFHQYPTDRTLALAAIEIAVLDQPCHDARYVLYRVACQGNVSSEGVGQRQCKRCLTGFDTCAIDTRRL